MRVVVGRVGRAHGIRGEVSVDVRTDDPETRFAPGSVLLPAGAAGSPSSLAPLVVEAARWHSGRMLVRFVGLADRSAAEALRGLVLEVDIDPAEIADDPEEFYDHQLVGLRVRRTDVEGSPADVGAVTEVVHLPGHDLLAVLADDGRELLVPFVTEIVPEVDVDGGFVLVAPPPGLLDEEAELAGPSADGGA